MATTRDQEEVRYPRPGQRIAPITLRDMLQVPVPRHAVDLGVPPDVLLCDLDETAWERWSSDTCRYLGYAVVAHVRRIERELVTEARSRSLPTVPSSPSLEDLDLEPRTYYALQRSGIGTPQRPFSGLTVRDILAVPRCGAKCLVDLLTALEYHATVAHPGWLGTSSTTLIPVVTRLGAREANQPQEPTPSLLAAIEGLRSAGFANQIRDNDPRLGATTRELRQQASVSGSTLEEILTNIVAQDCPTYDPEVVTDLVRAIHAEILALQRQTLEQELRELIGRSLSPRRIEIVVRRFGWDGRGVKTLQAVAEEYGVSRERVRQICSRAMKEVRGTEAFAPILDRALEFVRAHIPAPAAEVEALLVEAGITGSRFSLDGLRSAAEIFGRDPAFVLLEAGGVRVVTTPGTDNDGELTQEIVRRARRLVSHWGATTLDAVADALQESHGISVNRDRVARILVGKRDFAWLDESGGWFWISTVPRNRVLNRARKILSVVDRIGVSELRDGIARHHRMEGSAPPRHVLLELCRQAPGFRVERDEIIADPPLAWTEVLADVEKTMVRILLEHGPVLPRPEFERHCLSAGMPRTTFYAYLDNSPIITRYSRGVYGLRGFPVQPGLVESLTPRTHTRRVLQDYGWTEDGKIRLRYRISKAMLTNGVCSIPASMKPFLAGEFALIGDDDLQIGTLKCRAGSAWSLSSLFHRHGCVVDDHLILTFDLATRQVRIELARADDHSNRGSQQARSASDEDTPSESDAAPSAPLADPNVASDSTQTTDDLQPETEVGEESTGTEFVSDTDSDESVTESRIAGSSTVVSESVMAPIADDVEVDQLQSSRAPVVAPPIGRNRTDTAPTGPLGRLRRWLSRRIST